MLVRRHIETLRRLKYRPAGRLWPALLRRLPPRDLHCACGLAAVAQAGPRSDGQSLPAGDRGGRPATRRADPRRRAIHRRPRGERLPRASGRAARRGHPRMARWQPSLKLGSNCGPRRVRSGGNPALAGPRRLRPRRPPPTPHRPSRSLQPLRRGDIRVAPVRLEGVDNPVTRGKE